MSALCKRGDNHPATSSQRRKVNRFKALIIGGGKISGANLKHAPLDTDSFFEHLTLPVTILGVGTRWSDRHHIKEAAVYRVQMGRVTKRVMKRVFLSIL